MRAPNGQAPPAAEHLDQIRRRTTTLSTAATTLVYIILPNYLFFYQALGLNDFDAGKSITRAIGRGGPKKSRFPRPTPSNAPFQWMLHASKPLRTAPYKQQVH
jgi:hypothetical protein